MAAQRRGTGADTPTSSRRPHTTSRTLSQLTDPKKLARSCKPNRGSSSNPLFLLNNWIDTSPAPKPSNAEQVNAYRALLDRARKCERRRGQIPNLVAVDFYGVGDLMRVVDQLNGVSPPSHAG